MTRRRDRGKESKEKGGREEFEDIAIHRFPNTRYSI